MTYGYIRVSTGRQTVENQRFEILKFAGREKIAVDGWIEETISGTKDYSQRKLGVLLKDVGAGDLIICAELSRLGRSLFMIMEILQICMRRGCRVWTIKDNYRLGDDISSKVLAFAFGLSAEIERNLISQRTREALARIRAEGRKLGRPFGAKSGHVKLSGQEDVIRDMLEAGRPKTAIARDLGVHPMTLVRFLRDRMDGFGIGPYAVMPEGCADDIMDMLDAGMSRREIASRYGVNMQTVIRYIHNHMHVTYKAKEADNA